MGKVLDKKNKIHPQKPDVSRLVHETWQVIAEEKIRTLLSSKPNWRFALKNAKGKSTKNYIFTQ